MATCFRQNTWCSSTRRGRTHPNPWCPPQQQLQLHGSSAFGGSVLVAELPRNQNVTQMAPPNVYPIRSNQQQICMMLPPTPRPSLLRGRTLTINMCPPVPQPYFTNGSFSVGYQIPPTVEPGDLYGSSKMSQLWAGRSKVTSSLRYVYVGGQRGYHSVQYKDSRTANEYLYGAKQSFKDLVIGMEHKWKACFEVLFQNLPHIWMFGVCESEYSGWLVFRDMAKVRFSCQHCGRRWSSMNSSAVFYYAWDAEAQCGHIRFSLKGQKCRQCRPTHFETPMWYPEEVQKVMTNLYYEVASSIYGFYTPPMIKSKRHGRPRAHHDSSMCQGCNQSFCQVAKI